MSEAEKGRLGERDTEPARTALAATGAVLGLLAIALLAKGLYPADLPAVSDPDFVDNVFDNRAVVWAARLLLVSAAAVLAFGGIFIAISICVRMGNGEWLRKAGPFEIAEPPLVEAERSMITWRQNALASKAEVAELTERLARAEQLIPQVRGTVDED